MLRVATKFKPKPQAFRTAESAGFRHAEFWLDAGFLGQWKEVADRAGESKLSFALHFPNRSNLSDENLDQATRLYRRLDCSAMVIHEPMLQRYGQRLLELDDTLRLGTENHRLDESQFERWAVANDWLTLDVEHLWKYTLDDAPLETLLQAVRDFLKRFGDKLVHVHLPGYLPGCQEHRPMYCSREMVFSVFSLLADAEFEGLIVSEVNAQFQNLQELQMDVLLFERWQELHQSDPATRRPSINPRVA